MSRLKLHLPPEPDTDTTPEILSYRRQHGEVIDQETMEAGRRRSVVQSPVERLYARSSITPRQYHAAERLYRAYALGIVGARDPERKPSGEYSPSGYSDAQLAAATDYRRAITALGPRLRGVIEHVVVGEVPVVRLAETLGQSREELMGVLKVSLDILADHYRFPSDQ